MAWASDSSDPTQSTTAAHAAGELAVVEHERRRGRADDPVELARGAHRVGAQLLGPAPLLRGAWRWRQTLGAGVAAQRGDGEQAQGPAPRRRRRAVARAGRRARRRRGSTSTACSSVRSSGTATTCDGWATISVDQPPPVVSQKPHCEPGLEVAERHPLAQVDAPGPAHVARRVDPAPRSAARGSPRSPAAVVEVADDLVAGRERERHDGLEVARRPAVDGGQVAAADAGQAGPQPQPAGAGQLGRVDVAQRQGP